ncbi:MAG: PD40 domain-containing protein, partial [Deltaproteobacteria bacterium]|nr:PD40 domain-containing protein [Deltaproteobacteria bacterium]
MDIVGKNYKLFNGFCLAFLLMIAQIGCQSFDYAMNEFLNPNRGENADTSAGLETDGDPGPNIDADTSTGVDNNTFKLAYALNWQRITIGTFVDNKLVDEQFISSSQNPNRYASGDLKPSWSKSGNYITFMRTISGSATGQGADIRTAVINLNSLEIKELTAGNFEEYHPTWYRDGSNRVISDRLTQGVGWSTMVSHINSQPGDETIVPYGLVATSVLMDGTLISSSGNKGLWSYNLDKKWQPRQFILEVPFPENVQLHTPSVSPDETQVAIAVDFSNFSGKFAGINFVPDYSGFNYDEKLIYIGDLDKENFTITNLRNITSEKRDLSYGVGYPRWSPDGKRIVYHTNINGKFAIALYELETKSTVV